MRVIVELYNLRLKLALEWLCKWFRGDLYAFEIESFIGAIRGYIRYIRCKASVFNGLTWFDMVVFGVSWYSGDLENVVIVRV